MAIPTAPAQTSTDAGFATALFGAWPDQAGNLLLSPWSAREALAMTSRGARGITREEMMAVLRLATESDAQPMRLPDVADPHSGFTFLAANSVWLQQTLPVLSSFLENVREFHSAEIRGADFRDNPEHARATINLWVAKKTQDIIRELLQPGRVTKDTAFVLVNALYLRAQWLHRFDPRRSLRSPFHALGGSLPSVTMMSLTEAFLYHEAEGCQAVFLPYRGSEQGMAVLLPAPDHAQEMLTTCQGPEALFEALHRMQPKEVHVQLPRFRLRYAKSMKHALMTLGMRVAFSELADFTAMVQPRDRVRISDVVQECVVDVGEEGTEAAAATAVVMALMTCPAPGEPPVEFRADRPFLFAITDRQAKAVLFLGRVCEL